MRLRRPLFPIWSFFVLVIVLSTAPALAATAVVRTGDTIQLGEVAFRLDGADAPELDQTCIDDHADPWTCGIEARDQLTGLIGSRTVHCDDLGPDKTFRKRRAGLCTIDGDSLSLNQQLVRQGLALSVEGLGKTQFAEDAKAARDAKRGLWKGCFAAPQEFRAGKKDGALLGAACRADRSAEIRAVLFPDAPAMPGSCNIKGKLAARARFTGNVGIYHLQGCLSYAGTTRPDRWFCSEDDAQAAGFRRAFNCRASDKQRK
ncbi:thermonuclease family protein [Bradyrhizobium sp.]|jgi:endonuclease YncB( thermonuclease family)|uniref:thermonuclease family protein n=1 Tax=Bradyrhizobium sp. TaxID=376 RepID=UPI002BD0E0FF|nr:thermonuclease family protein [Bradyrhizobium sp.]HWX62531.1 thermonuclease family protein [Bradyrhizobium sp.]